jgi:quinol monooxygenase YgiN
MDEHGKNGIKLVILVNWTPRPRRSYLGEDLMERSEREAEDMVHVSLLVRLEAKPGKEAELGAFLKGALPLANQEATTRVWFALQSGPSTFYIFDAFDDDKGRQAHLAGPIAAALMAKAPELLAKPPQIDKVDVLAVKLSV